MAAVVSHRRPRGRLVARLSALAVVAVAVALLAANQRSLARAQAELGRTQAQLARAHAELERLEAQDCFIFAGAARRPLRPGLPQHEVDIIIGSRERIRHGCGHGDGDGDDG